MRSIQGSEHRNENLFSISVADSTRLELATSAVTGQRSNQLSYGSNYRVLYIIISIFSSNFFY